MKKVSVYVSAPITFSLEKKKKMSLFLKLAIEGNKWRKRLYKKLEKIKGIDIIDPLKYDIRGQEDDYKLCVDVVQKNKEDIKRADVVIANSEYCSWGTAMELHYAATVMTKPIFIVCSKTGTEVSPWLQYLQTFTKVKFVTEKTLFEHLEKMIKDN
jgi:nucleoside 2-deoxyribosyltransferase